MEENKLQQPTNRMFNPKSNVTYEYLPNGDHVYGLVSIKDVDIAEKKYNQTTKKSTPTGRVLPGYRLSFRARENSKAWINVEEPAKFDVRSNLFKYVRNMTRKTEDDVKSLTKEEFFKLLISCNNKWYNIFQETKTWVKKDGSGTGFRSKPVDKQITPHKGIEETPLTFFEKLVKENTTTDDTDNESVNADFSGYADAEEEEGTIYYYDEKKCSPKRIEDMRRVLKDNNATFSTFHELWECTTDVKLLDKFKTDTPKEPGSQTSFEDDDISF